uniref:TctD-like protein n=1 Tax=Schizymenia dubyi TaxID=38368 RepID=A0A1C9C9H2_9FLOR|nr:hypothetical protein Schiz_153 [Schizymenia dubyi]AOM65036.1 hypothetical protein Schiz_153 [Schizymenia dubyi]
MNIQKYLLLVDDDPLLRKSISLFLISQGFFVRTADNVESALLIIKEKSPDVVITDIMMPKLDGYDLIKILHADTSLRKIPIIFLTAKGMTHDRIKGYDLGCNAYLIKPFSPDELVSIINNLLKNNSSLSLHQNENNQFVLIENLSTISDLTSKEKTILFLVAKGSMNKEIAMDLNLSVRNIEKYISRLLKKLILETELN